MNPIHLHPTPPYDCTRDSLTDEAAALLAQTGDRSAQTYLLEKYAGMVAVAAKAYYLQGAEREDILQEGNIGLLEAIRDYSEDKQCSFRSFARLCITRQIITAVKVYSSQKHSPLNLALSIHVAQQLEDGKEGDFDPSDPLSPSLDELLISREWLQSTLRYMHAHLTPFERAVLSSYLSGSNYQDMAEHFGTSVKSIDGTLQRVRKKMKRHFSPSEF